jgi:hypothetical protein
LDGEVNSSVGVANILVVFMSALKGSPLGFMAGLSYEKVNSFHRWIGRLILALFFAHGVMHTYLGIVKYRMTFADFVARPDVIWGISAFACLVLLSTLYTHL